MQTIKRTILVTGASSGIGRAVAERLLTQNHQVIGISRDISKFARRHDNFHPVQLDLSKLETIPARLQDIMQRFQALDGIIFAAGAGLFGSLEEFSYSQIQQSLNLNFLSNAYITRSIISPFKRKARSDLIYIGSEAALKGSRKGTVYCAGKFALRGFTQALREECAKDGVRVCLINPGMVKTAFFESLNFAPGDSEANFLIVEDIADAVSYILNSRPEMLIDEINLNPASKVVKKKPG